MMRAWLESAATGCAPRKSELTRMTRMTGNSLREVIFTPSRGSGSIVRRFADGAGYKQHASSYRLARGGRRQGKSAARDARVLLHGGMALHAGKASRGLVLTTKW